MKIIADATLPYLESWFSHSAFKLTTYQTTEELQTALKTNDILVCRSTLKVTAELLADSSIQVVATASSGTDHIDEEFLAQRNIALFDAKGCNARAVADYVVSALAWLDTQGLMKGNKAGIIGCGEVGSRVMDRLHIAGFTTQGYDPPKAQQFPEKSYCSFSDLLDSDVLLVHANLHTKPTHPSQNLIDQPFLSELRPGTIIINAARGGIVNETSILNHRSILYCTDVFCNEPQIDARVIDHATLCTPHIAGHSIEAKIKAVKVISEKIHQFYALNLPTVKLPPQSTTTVPSGDWRESVLSLYNPWIDTMKLKCAEDTESTFLKLRKSHKYRHDFIGYEAQNLSKKTRLLIGHNS